MLTASRDVMNGANHSETRKLHPYRRHTCPPTGFAPGAAICPFFGADLRDRYIAVATGLPTPLREHGLTALSRLPAVARDLMMDMDLTDFLSTLQTAARSVGAEVTSPWFYFQVGVVLTGAVMQAVSSTPMVASTIDGASTVRML